MFTPLVIARYGRVFAVGALAAAGAADPIGRSGCVSFLRSLCAVPSPLATGPISASASSSRPAMGPALRVGSTDREATGGSGMQRG